MTSSKAVRYRFGDFEVNLTIRELSRKGQRIHLQDKPFLFLSGILTKHGSVVSREELARLLWPDTFVQEAQGLNAAVRKVRLALGDDARRPRFIETLGSRGYRFVHPVEEIDSDAQSSSSVRLAVVPWHCTGQSADALASGLLAELIDQCGHLAKVQVIAPASMLPPSTISEQAGRSATHVLTGHLTQEEGMVRIVAFLVDARDRSCIWSERFDVGRRDLLKLESEVASTIVHAVEHKLTGNGRH